MGINVTKEALDFGVKDVEGLEELQHTDNRLDQEIWESAPELLSLLAPL